MKYENSAEVIKETRVDILNTVSQFDSKSQEITVSDDEAMVRTDHTTVPVKFPECVTEEVCDEILK